MKYLVFFIYVGMALFAQEIIVVAYDTTKAPLRPLKHELKNSFAVELKKYGGTLHIEQIGDRYALIVKGVFDPKARQLLMLELSKDFDDVFYISTGGTEAQARQQPPKKEHTKENTLDWEWVVIGVLTLVLVILFGKGVRDMMQVRRSQRLIRHEQMKIENELRKEI